MRERQDRLETARLRRQLQDRHVVVSLLKETTDPHRIREVLILLYIALGLYGMCMACVWHVYGMCMACV